MPATLYIGRSVGMAMKLVLVLVVSLAVVACGSAAKSGVTSSYNLSPWTLSPAAALSATESLTCSSSASCVSVQQRGDRTVLALADPASGKTQSSGGLPMMDAPVKAYCMGGVCLVAADICDANSCTQQVTRYVLASHLTSRYTLDSEGAPGGSIRMDCDNNTGTCVAAAQTAGRVRLSVSSDFGENWKPWTMARVNSSPAIEAEACPSARVCVVAVGSSLPAPGRAEILRTDDGGSSWKASDLPSGVTINAISAISCGAADSCIATGIPATLHSATAGASWVLAGPLRYPNVSYLSCTGASTCVAQADGGELGWTDSAGQSWSWAAIPQLQWTGIFCESTTTCIVGAHSNVSELPLRVWRMTRS